MKLLTSGVVAALLAGCASSQSLPTTTSTDPAAALKQHSRTFTFTGGEQTFKVPRRVHSIKVDAYGGGTKAALPRKPRVNALGGRTQATLPVTPGETLAIFVGGDGTTGFNGGGSEGGGDCFVYSPGNGAGASDVREHGDGLSNRILVAGGAGGNEGRRGGAGGGLIGGSAAGQVGKNGGGGTGGTQSAGGAAGLGGQPYGVAGNPGALGVGGAGGLGDPSYNRICGGGGGGGYYGGGGGGASGGSVGSGGGGFGGGGGGGSSFTEPSAKNVTLTQGYSGATGNGSVTVSW